MLCFELLAAWTHQFDPIAVRMDWFLNGGIRWYGLSYLVGFILAWFLMRRVVMCSQAHTMGSAEVDLVNATQVVSLLTPKKVWDEVMLMAIFGVIGADV